MPEFLTHNFLKYPTNYRANRENWEWKTVEAGQVVDDVPPPSRDWLQDAGHIEPVDRAMRRIETAIDDGDDLTEYELAFYDAHKDDATPDESEDDSG